MVDLKDEEDDAEDSGKNHGHSRMLRRAPVAPAFHSSRLSLSHLSFDSKTCSGHKNTAELNDQGESESDSTILAES